MPDLTGQIIKNHYRVDTLLGRGGMGDVYKVWDNQRAVFLAMKVLHADLAEDKVFLRRFAREADTLSTLQHPHIVRFYGLEQEKSVSFILMDYVEGTTLRRLIFEADKPFSPGQMMQIMRPVCSALHYAHKMGRAHCDIKPANIMVRANGDVLVADFGIARMLESSTIMTMVGAGTPAYMAPEQIKGKQPVPQTDIYALGIVLFEMLTAGERPFTGEMAGIDGTTSEKVRWEQINLHPPSPRKYNAAISPFMEKVVLRCLEKEPENRYTSALGFLEDFEQACGVLSGTDVYEAVERTYGKVSTEPIPKRQKDQAPEPMPRQKRLAGFGWIAVILVLLGLFWAFLSERPTNMNKDAPTYTPLPTYTLLPTYPPPPTSVPPTNPPPPTSISPTSPPLPTSKPPTLAPVSVNPEFTANQNMFCREGPSSEFDSPTEVSAGQTVPVYAKWSNGWLLVGISNPDTRTKCCWVGGDGYLNVSSSNIKTIDYLVDRITCQRK